MNMSVSFKLIALLIAVFFPAVCFAKVDQWSWYYATFVSVNSHKSDIRYGLAEINIHDGKITGYLIEEHAPELRIPLSGSISGDHVTIELPTFFPSYTIEFSGKVRSGTYEGCKYEEIRFQYEVPNGETMVMTKNTGDCP